MMKHIKPFKGYGLSGAELVDRQEFWIAMHKNDVRYALNEKRNYCQGELREHMVKIVAAKKEDLYPDETQILQILERKGLQKGPNLKQMQGFLDMHWDVLLPKVAGNTNWPPTKRHYNNLSTAETDPKITVDTKKGEEKVKFMCVDHTTEAFLVAIWENCYPRWRYQALQKRKKLPVVDTHDDMKGKDYTDAKGGCQKLGGWTKLGKDRVKELAKLNKAAREEPHVKEVETAALERIRYVFGSNWYPNVVFWHLH
jgi:hypothetical protein